MVFGLVLHSAHQYEPEEVCLLIVPAGDDLVVNEVMLDLLIIPDLPFVVSNQHKGRVKPSNQIAQQEVQQVIIVVKNDHVVDRNAYEFHL
jgi:hypothetical protein